jgi:hypothetical protein
MGINYYCGEEAPVSLDDYQDCSGENLLSFVPQTPLMSNTRVTYVFSKRADDSYTIQRCVGNDCVEIISSDVKIDTLKFFVTGSDPRDSTQANVYILLKGTVTVKGKDSSFMIQTLASQRNY